MKIKITYIILSLLVILAGCDKYTMPDTEVLTGRYIFFDACVPQTKGTLVDDDALKVGGEAFGVFGYRGTTPIFVGYNTNIAKVYRPEGSSATSPKAFTYDNLENWTTSNHRFYAYYPYESSYITAVNTTATVPYISYSQPTTLEEMVDVMTAYKSTSVVPSVDLSFVHRLWALNVDVELTQENHPLNPNGAPSLTIKSAKIYLKNIASKGDLHISDNLTLGISSEDYVSTEYILKSSESSHITLNETTNTHSFGPLLFLPTDVQIAENQEVQYRLEFEFLNSWGESFNYSYPAEAGAYEAFAPTTTLNEKASLLAGKKYTLKLTKGDGADIVVTFNTNNNSWSYNELTHGFN